MPIHGQVMPAQIGESAIVGASKGVSLSTAAVFTALKPNTQQLNLSPYTFSTAVVARYNISPWITVLKNQDAFATEPIICSLLLQDGDNTVTMSMNSFDTLANGDALYIGSHLPIGGLWVDVQNTNSNAAVLAVHYYNGTLTSLSATDNTITSSTHSFGQDGTITWTTPSDWLCARFSEVFGVEIDNKKPIYSDPLFWCRLTWDAAFDSSTSINQIIAINRRSTLGTPVYEELSSGQSWTQSLKQGFNGFGAVEALTDAGTALLIHKVSTYGRAKFQPAAPAAL